MPSPVKAEQLQRVGRCQQRDGTSNLAYNFAIDMIVHAKDRVFLPCLLGEQAIAPRHVCEQGLGGAQDGQHHRGRGEGRARRRMHDPVAIAPDRLPEGREGRIQRRVDQKVVDLHELGGIERRQLTEGQRLGCPPPRPVRGITQEQKGRHRGDPPLQRQFHRLLDQAVGVGQFRLDALPIIAGRLLVIGRSAHSRQRLLRTNGDLPREVELVDPGGVKFTRRRHIDNHRSASVATAISGIVRSSRNINYR